MATLTRPPAPRTARRYLQYVREYKQTHIHSTDNKYSKCKYMWATLKRLLVHVFEEVRDVKLVYEHKHAINRVLTCIIYDTQETTTVL